MATWVYPLISPERLKLEEEEPLIKLSHALRDDSSGFSPLDRLFGPGHKMLTHDETGEAFMWRGGEEVNVREKVKVESGDPSMISVARS
ncbi:hypothetical protein EPUS_07404 [Endocarpon pusillum Z07020]|uniref:Uncharacterized protein n=1 Tax=Endocarpon pusillum (strain Z07020 / HMAS-L-300199) TaxID=1263415 RepID=U1I2L5_ENDPU|nr:uncharacterized protein EPUS_07404 [Endocarpon pusillum Z07020]ERF76204.1 hypothetical protein EPUS_07404 [Endocarpon pusillum Z07020]